LAFARQGVCAASTGRGADERRGTIKAMIEWLILPALILIIVLAIVTARPKHVRQKGKDDEPKN
jgi:hypothetical protein